MTFGATNDGSTPAGVEVEVKVEEEETLGQLRDRQALAAARAAAPGPRAVFVHIKVEDTDGEGAGGEDGEEATGGEGHEEGKEEEEEEEVEEQEAEEEEEEEEEKQEEEEQGEGQHREQHEVAPPRRARLPPGSYADTAVEHEEDEEDEEDEWGAEEEEEEEEEEEAEPRDPRAQEYGASSKGGSEAVCPRRLTPVAPSGPGSPRARLRAPRRVADNAIQDNADGQEESLFPELRKREGGGHAGSSQFLGVSWDKSLNKWTVECKGKRLGCHATERGAARAYSKYLEDGIDPVKHRAARTSQFMGVSWDKSKKKWAAGCKGTKLGCHATEVDAARAISNYLEEGIDPVKHRDPAPRSSRGSPGTQARISGRRNPRKHIWVITTRRKLRLGRTTSKLRASVSSSTSSCPPEPKPLAQVQAAAVALAPGVLHRSHRLLRRGGRRRRSTLLLRHWHLPRRVRRRSCRTWLWAPWTRAASQRRSIGRN